MGAKPSSFKRKLLASSISSCLLASAGAVIAQEQAELEEVVVTGIRASTVAAMDVKRDSNGVVDAISAEDIGKMPDANLAESLQRITGLSISRTNGEGARVTVRGIDPAFNMVTLNGRNMPAVTNDGNVADTASRAYDFANLASEVVNGVEVYKTGKADITSGGLGAVINIKTVRPLEVGNKGSVAAKLVSDETASRGDAAEVTPELSGLYSWANDDSTFGVAVAVAHQVRENSRSNVFINQWKLENDISVVNENAEIRNYQGGMFNLPSDVRYALEDNERTRTNGLLTVQYAPTDTLTATVDYVFSEYELAADRSQQSTWYNYSNITYLEFDYNTVQAPAIYEESYPGAGKDTSFAQQEYTGETSSNSIGFNVQWDLTEDFTLEFDAHSSTAENISQYEEAGLNANVTTKEYADFRGAMPVIAIQFDDSSANLGNNNGILDGGDVSGAMGTIARAEQTTDITQVQLKGIYSLSDDAHLSFGMESREDENHTLVGDGGATGRITMGNWGGVDPDLFNAPGTTDWTGDVAQGTPSSFWRSRDFGEGFPDYSESTGYSEGLNGNTYNFLSYGLDTDLGIVKDRMEQMLVRARENVKAVQDPNNQDDPDATIWLQADADNQQIIQDPDWEAPDDDPDATPNMVWADADGNVLSTPQLSPNNFNGFPDDQFKWNGIINLDRTITEEVTAFYVQYDNRFEIDGMEAGIVIGLRHEQTDVTATSNAQIPVQLVWEENNDWSQRLSADPMNLSDSGSYSNLLPSIDFSFNPSDDVVVRASYSKTLGRPGYGDLRADVGFDDVYSRTANQGNTGLKPLVSTNLDVSAEWYYKDDSMMSIGLFRKDVANFIGSSVVETSWYDLRDPRTGARFDAAIAAIEAKAGQDYPYDEDPAGETWNPQSETHQHTQMLLNEGLDPNDPSTSILSSEDAAEDDLFMWQTRTPVNDKAAKINGIELAIQHWFGESGFGASANYTAVNTNVDFDITDTRGQFALVGVSDTANMALFYDNYGIQARVNYNWREKFLDNRNQYANEPSFTEAFHQIDFSLSYDIMDDLSVSLEGLNVTGENSRRHGRSSTQLWSLEDLGARYSLGVRYSF